MAGLRPRAKAGSDLDSQDSPPAAHRAVSRERIPGHLRGVTIHPYRSKERVVRLEPFFATAPVAPRRPGQAARFMLRGWAAAAADSNRTATRLEIPDSSIVTP